MPVDLVVEALDGIVAAAEVEVLATHDQNVDVLGEVAVEDVGVAAVGEHFFDLVGGGVGGGHDGFLLSFFGDFRIRRRFLAAVAEWEKGEG